MRYPDYTYEIFPDEKIISIQDSNLGNMSVTNAIETVVEEIAKENNLEIERHEIIYKDSDGIWDGFNYKAKQFIPLSCDNQQSAISKIINLK